MLLYQQFVISVLKLSIKCFCILIEFTVKRQFTIRKLQIYLTNPKPHNSSINVDEWFHSNFEWKLYNWFWKDIKINTWLCANVTKIVLGESVFQIQDGIFKRQRFDEWCKRCCIVIEIPDRFYDFILAIWDYRKFALVQL